MGTHIHIEMGGGSQGGSGSNNSRNVTATAVSTTYAELKAMRDGGNLEPGTWYRITDYVCTTTKDNTQSAEHPFDIIVRADDASHLNENGYAAHHAGDTYFATCKLEAWELKYSLDNDTNRFAWADDENGKGVIFYMKDEWNNECPYDFKNILFERSKITECLKSPDLIGLYAKDGANGIAVDDEQKFMVPTFCMIDLRDGTIHDVSVEQDVYPSDEGCCYKTNNNHISDCIESFQGDNEQFHYVMTLPDVVFVTDTEICGIEENYGEFYGFTNNRFGNNCKCNTFGNYCQFNSFGNNCYSNTFGNGCQFNTFGNNCGGNTFGNNCTGNTFGNGCYNNTFGNYCQNNSFGNDCNNNTFGNYCQNNTLGNNCGGNTFGNDCFYNTFGNDCYNNTFGNDYRSNTFGNECYENTFGNYCQTITVFDGVQNCSVTGGSQSAPVKNAQILNGTAGASARNNLTIAFAANKDYTQVAAKTTAGNLKVFNPADLVQ